MSDATFPRRTAAELRLPNDDTVWVCTLNSLLSDEVREETSFFTAKKCRPISKGGADYSAVMAEIRGKPATEQAELIADGEFRAIKSESEAKHPVPEKPNTSGEDAVKDIEAAAKWEEECRKAEEKRLAFQQKRYGEEVKKALALTAKTRIDRAYAAWVSLQWATAYSKRFVLETLQRAVRRDYDHSVRYFPNVVAVEDADDDVLQALCRFYFEELATVTHADIPT